MGCRARHDKQSLIRFVADEAGRLRPDPRQRARGRGCYLCPQRACAEAALRRGGFGRGLKRRVVVPALQKLWADARAALAAATRELVAQAISDGRVRKVDASTSGEPGWMPGADRGGATSAVVTDKRFMAQLQLLSGQLEELGRWPGPHDDGARWGHG